jgi:hypothetical protein
MVVFLVFLAILGWIGGSLLLSQATYGVGAIAAACLFAILARIAQAGEQHREMVRLMRAGLGMPDQGMPPPSRPGGWVCPQCRYENGAALFDCPNCGAARPTTTRYRASYSK